MNEANFQVDFIGIGAQRAASTWIFKCLSEHPEICGSQPKETHFFTSFNKNSFTWYQSRFAHCREKIKGEYSALYLSDPAAPKKIKEKFPNIKLIVCLRGPITRAFSHYNFKLSNKVPLSSFSQALKKYPEILERGLYYKYLQNYLKYFSQDEILILIYEDIKKDPKNFIKNVYKFLRVDENFLPRGLEAKINSQEARASKTNKKINKYYHKLKNKKYGRIIITGLKQIGINKFFIDKTFKKRKKDSAITEEEKNKLINFYQADIKKLEKLIKRDLSFWR